MQRFISGGLTLALTAASTVLLIGATQGSADAAPVATKFAYGGSGYGTLLQGGQIPAGSSMTAFKPLGCTNLAGISKENHEAASPLGGFGNVSAVATKVWTSKVGTTYSSNAKNTIASVTLGDPSLGSIKIKGIESTSRAFHDPSGFHAKTTTTVAQITFAPAGMDPQVIPIPAPGQPIDIPGLAHIVLGAKFHKVGTTGAVAQAKALVIQLIPSGTTLTVGFSRATIGGGITVGVFQGNSYSTKVNALDKNLTSGPTPLTVMPCQGTHGVIQSKKIASLNLGGQIVVGAVTSSQRGNQKSGIAYGWEKATVARISLGGNQLVITGIVGKATVTRKGHMVKTSAAGTQVGTITAGGEVMTFPDTGVIEIPGVAKIENTIVTKGPIGIKVVALRITLLDGSGAVIDLGTAQLKCKASGL
jgi:hypothetical protein